ncbi:MAG: glucose-6-phosphate isomerase [Acidobacteriota bacterium]
MTDEGGERSILSAGGVSGELEKTFERIAGEHFVSRIWDRDSTLWKKDDEARKIIDNALGWLDVVPLVRQSVGDLTAFADEIRRDFEAVVVLGMGGSSLCPEVLRRSFGKRDGFPSLHVLDSTVPAAVRDLERQLDVAKTLFIVASKSGGTTEPQMFYRYFRTILDGLQGENAGKNFIAITDPGTALDRQAHDEGFRRIFTNPADIGGRYSALSFFGMVPASLAGYDVEQILSRAEEGMHFCRNENVRENPGARLGVLIATAALSGRNKLTLIADAPLDSVGLWIEQLIAESTGKEGRGVIPVAGADAGPPDDYGDDRLFVWIHEGKGRSGEQIRALADCGSPFAEHALSSALDLGQEFFVWEFATAVVGALLDINPFDQPNVQESKDNTKRLLQEFVSSGKLPGQQKITEGRQIEIYGEQIDSGSEAQQVLAAHFATVKPGDYVAITQYIEETAQTDRIFHKLQSEISRTLHVATTTGYGPRFLHSTGQLHKGGDDSGVFIQITAKDPQDLPIAGEPFGFSVLQQAQSLGDFQSLDSRKRRALRIHLKNGVIPGLEHTSSLILKALAMTKPRH